MNKNFIPNYLTLGNIFCGFLSIIMTSQKQFILASVFIILATLADRYDGIVARKLGVSNELGKELDSLCDVVSFGAAPALLVFTKILNADLNVAIIILAGIICGLYVCCGAYRLARFNITTSQNKGVYQGVPITTCGLFLAVILFFAIPYYITLPLTAVLAYLMVSKIKIKKI